MKKIFLLIFIISFSFAQAQGTFPLVTCKGLDCTWPTFIDSLQRLIRAFLIIGYWIAAIVALVGAFMIMLGGYQKGWLNTGKKMIIDALVYYVVLLLAGVLFDLFLDFIGPRLFGE